MVIWCSNIYLVVKNRGLCLYLFYEGWQYRKWTINQQQINYNIFVGLSKNCDN